MKNWSFLNVKNYDIIYNGLDEKQLQEKVVEKINIEKNNSIILMIVGTIDKRKNQQNFINDVFIILNQKYRNLKLILVGKESIELNINCTNIVLIGEVTNSLPYINSSDIIISYSLNEVLPINLIEAMFCSKPIIATNVGGCAEQIISNYNGFLVENSQECISGLSYLIEKEDERLRMGKNGKKIFNENFTISNYQKYEKLICS